VFRGKYSALSPRVFPIYFVHGGLAVLAVWLVFKAMGA
jgi:hypothetical protein